MATRLDIPRPTAHRTARQTVGTVAHEIRAVNTVMWLGFAVLALTALAMFLAVRYVAGEQAAAQEKLAAQQELIDLQLQAIAALTDRVDQHDVALSTVTAAVGSNSKAMAAQLELLDLVLKNESALVDLYGVRTGMVGGSRAAKLRKRAERALAVTRR